LFQNAVLHTVAKPCNKCAKDLEKAADDASYTPTYGCRAAKRKMKDGSFVMMECLECKFQKRGGCSLVGEAWPEQVNEDAPVSVLKNGMEKKRKDRSAASYGDGWLGECGCSAVFVGC
jgi:hypothetical protein